MDEKIEIILQDSLDRLKTILSISETIDVDLLGRFEVYFSLLII